MVSQAAVSVTDIICYKPSGALHRRTKSNDIMYVECVMGNLWDHIFKSFVDNLGEMADEFAVDFECYKYIK